MLYFYIFSFILNAIGMMVPPFGILNIICMIGFISSLCGIISYCIENASDENDDNNYQPTKHDLYKEKDWNDQ